MQAGDCNADGVIDAADLSALSLEVSNPGTFDATGCDADGSGVVTTADLACARARIFDPAARCTLP